MNQGVGAKLFDSALTIHGHRPLTNSSTMDHNACHFDPIPLRGWLGVDKSSALTWYSLLTGLSLRGEWLPLFQLHYKWCVVMIGESEYCREDLHLTSWDRAIHVEDYAIKRWMFSWRIHTIYYLCMRSKRKTIFNKMGLWFSGIILA